MTDLDIEKILNEAPPEDIKEIAESVLSDAHFDVRSELAEKLPYTKRIGVNDIVPEEYQQRLMEIDFTMTQCYWLIGDITTDLVNSVNRQKAKELGKIVSKSDIFEAVGFFCHRTGRSVRYYYECAHYFPPEVRQKYDVPFTIYSEARWVKDWELMLQLAEENPMWSAEKVRAEYYKQVDEVPQTRGKGSEDGGAETGSADLPLPEGDEIWQAPGRFKEELISNLDHTLDGLRKILDRVKLPTDVRVRIGNVLLEIEDIKLEVRREV